MLTLLLGTDWKHNRDVLIQKITEEVHMEKPGIIWMVPELISHQTERELAQVAGDTASRFAEVLSFSRLAKRVSDDCGIGLAPCLDNGGRVVAMAAATRQLHSKLKAYAAVETKPEFLTGLLDAVDEFKRCCIQPADLLAAARQTEGNLAQKLEELSLILESYNAICSRGKRDPRDQMTWLLEQLEECDFGKKHTFYFDCFPDFSRQHMQILYHLLDHSPQVVISLNCDRPDSGHMAFEKAAQTAAEILSYAQRNGIDYEVQYLQGENGPLEQIANNLLQGNISDGFAAGSLHTYRTESVYNACAVTVEKILELVQNGCRYRDISIVCPDLQTYQGPIHSVMHRAHIPVYLSGTEDILEKTVIHTVLCAMDAALSGFDSKDVVRYLKSMLSPVEPDLCDKIENYAIMWAIDGTGWLQEWKYHPRGMEDQWTQRDLDNLAALNGARQKAILPLSRLRDSFRDAISVPQQVLALYGFLTDIQLNSRLRRLAAEMEKRGDFRNAQILNQLWEILLGALEQLHDTLTEVSWDGETFSRLLRLLLQQYDVGTIPSVLDSVTVGSVSAMRCQRCRHLFVLGMSEGAFPSYGSSAGVLNDQERSILLLLGMPLNPGAIDGLQTQFSEIQEVFSTAGQSVSVFCADGQPSFVFNRLVRMTGREEAVTPVYGAALTDPWEAAAYLAARDGIAQAEELGISQQYQAVSYAREHQLGNIGEDHIRQLYGDKLFLSASQIDRVAECRMSYFLKYGMRAKERNPAAIDPAQFGTYVHAVLEECGKAVMERGGFRNVTLEQTLELAADASARYFAEQFSQISTSRMTYHFDKNAREVRLIVEELWKEMQESSFQPYDFELGFGTEDGKMPAVPIPGKKMNAQLGGYVDRVDRWDCAGKDYIRVVDYKTGKKDFDYCDVFNGIGLQMLLYLYALEDGGEQLFGDTPIIAGVQYFPARVPLVAADGSMTEEEAEQAHLKDFKRKGLILSDENVLQAMEPSDQPQRLSIKRKKDGSVTGDIASSHQFVQLKRYVFRLLEGIVDEIASGNVTPNPYTRGSSHNACRFCPYGAVCRSAEVEGRRNYQAMTADRFWTEIERSEQKNG